MNELLRTTTLCTKRWARGCCAVVPRNIQSADLLARLYGGLFQTDAIGLFTLDAMLPVKLCDFSRERK